MKKQNRQRSNGPYDNGQKKNNDPTNWYRFPCKNGAKCTYRNTDEHGRLIKNYCKYIHHPYDLCPYKQECQYFQSQTCVWIHTTKPTKPVPVVPQKPRLTEDQFPAIVINNSDRPAPSNSIVQTKNPPSNQQTNNLSVTSVPKIEAQNPRQNPQSQPYLAQQSQPWRQVKTQKRQKQPDSQPEQKVQKQRTTKQVIPKQRFQQKNTQKRKNNTNQRKPINISDTYKEINIYNQISRLARQVLMYNSTKDEKDPSHYEHNIIKMGHILKLANDLRLTNKFQQPSKIAEQKNPLFNNNSINLQCSSQQQNLEENFEEDEQNQSKTSQISNIFRHVYQRPISRQPQNNQSILRQNHRMQHPLNQKNTLTSQNTHPNPQSSRNKSIDSNRGILIPKIFPLDSIDNKYPSLSKSLLYVFLEFLNQKEQNVSFKFEVFNNKFKIVQKYFDSDLQKDQKALKNHFLYEIQVLEQSCFDQLCSTIARHSYMPRRQNAHKHLKSIFKINSRSNLLNKKKFHHQFREPRRMIQRFFENLFVYIKFYFKSILKQFEGKSLQFLDVFYKPVLPNDIIPADSLESATNQKGQLKGPIYVGGMRNICMRFFSRLLQLFLKNDAYAIQKVEHMMRAKGFLKIESETIRNFMKEKNAQISFELLGDQYKDSYQDNRREKPMDQKLIEAEARNKLNSEIMIRTDHHIDQIKFGQKDNTLTQESMKEYIKLKAYERIYSDYNPETQVLIGEVQMIKRIAKGQIRIKQEGDKPKYMRKAKNRYNFLKDFFKQFSIQDDAKNIINEFVVNQTFNLGQSSFVYIFSDAKYIVEEPVEDNYIDFYLKEIQKKLSQRPNHPQNQTKIFYYAKANTGFKNLPLSEIAQLPFFKQKVLAFTQKSDYLLYCNQKFGFYGPQSMDTLKIRIHRQNGMIQFLNAKSEKQCQKYFAQICQIIQEHVLNRVPKEKLDQSYFFIKTKPYEAYPKHLSLTTNSQIDNFEIKSKPETFKKFKRQNLSILTWNLKRLFESDLVHRRIPKKQRLQSIINDLKTHKADIVCLQEVKDFKKQIQQHLCQQTQLYFMPFYQNIGDDQTIILTTFPVRFFSLQLGIRKIACCEFEIQTYVQPEINEEKQQIMKASIDTVFSKIREDKKIATFTQALNQSFRESNSRQKSVKKTQIKSMLPDQKITGQKEIEEKQQPKQIKNKSVLIMSIHLKATQMSSQSNFLESTQKREDQLEALQQFFRINETNQTKKYDIVLMAGDWNIGDESAQYREQGKLLRTCDHNLKYLNSPQYFDLQAKIYQETLQTFKTYLHKGQQQNGKFKLGGSRLDRILLRTHSSHKVEDIVNGLSELSLVGDYSIRKNQNVSEANFDKFTRSSSDHFGIYMEILLKI